MAVCRRHGENLSVARFYQVFNKLIKSCLLYTSEYVSVSVDKDRIAKENYNLSVSSYVEAKDTREVIDIDALNAEIKKTVKNIDRLRCEIDKIIAEIEG